MRNLPSGLTKKEFLREMTALAGAFRQQIEAGCTGFAIDPEASADRRRRVQEDFTFFRSTYFPHYVKDGAGDSILHTRLDAVLPQIVDDTEGHRLAIAAPRGEAKSTFVGLFFLIWCVVTGRKQYILLIADAKEQAASLLEAVKAELEANPRLAADFSEHTGQGRVWNVGVVINSANVKLQALGAGKKMRGLRHGPHRPDLVILDDLENDENVQSPEQRDKLQSWLQKTVLNLGPPDGSMDVVYVGTILHYDSVLARTLAKPGWQTLQFRAIITMPHNMRVWDEWEAVLASEGEQAALDFYAAQKSEMDRGAEVSWPGMRPLYRLMCLRAEDHAAFDSEQQNDPLAGDAAPFAHCLFYWSEKRPDWLYFGAIDPSLGKHGAGRDPSAILVGGLHRESMTLHVVEADIKKRHPDRIIADAIALHRQYKPLVWAVEAVQFQAFFAHVMQQTAITEGLVLPIRQVQPHTDKQLRIESLQPHMAAGRILLHTSQKTLVSQLRHFPKADHDDGPDALKMLWDIATTGLTSIAPADFVRVRRKSMWR